MREGEDRKRQVFTHVGLIFPRRPAPENTYPLPQNVCGNCVDLVVESRAERLRSGEGARFLILSVQQYQSSTVHVSPRAADRTTMHTRTRAERGRGLNCGPDWYTRDTATWSEHGGCPTGQCSVTHLDSRSQTASTRRRRAASCDSRSESAISLAISLGTAPPARRPPQGWSSPLSPSATYSSVSVV